MPLGQNLEAASDAAPMAPRKTREVLSTSFPVSEWDSDDDDEPRRRGCGFIERLLLLCGYRDKERRCGAGDGDGDLWRGITERSHKPVN